MSYQALYRTFRSQTFEGVVGQKETLQTLKNAIIQGKISHAYLFTGPRGTGKTSVARIFAKAINCPNLINGEPCNSCEICQGITTGAIDDVIELDAASNNGVDEIRNIRDTVIFPAKVAKIKVYIIDEVHMLSTGAFNALLKTLEEPPKNVVFILATTEPYKVPATIISRTQRFDFKRIDSQDIVEHLIYVLTDLQVAYEEKALQVIARKAQGGMRDALSILDQAISFSDEKVTLEDAMNVTGSLSFDLMDHYLLRVMQSETQEALRCIDQIMTSGKDAKRMLEDLLQYLRDLLLYKNAPEYVAKESGFLTDSFKELAEKLPSSVIYQYVEQLNQANLALKSTMNAQVVLEVVTVKLATLEKTQEQPSSMGVDVSGLQEEISQLKKEIKTLKSTGFEEKPAVVKKEKTAISFKEPIERVLSVLPIATKEIRQTYVQVWEDLLSMLEAPKRSMFHDYTIVVGTHSEVVLMYRDQAKFTASRAASDEALKLSVSDSLSKLTDYHPDLIIMTETGWKQVRETFEKTKKMPQEVTEQEKIEEEPKDPLMENVQDFLLDDDLIEVVEE